MQSVPHFKISQTKVAKTTLNWNNWGVTKLSTTRTKSVHNQHLMTVLKENKLIMQG